MRKLLARADDALFRVEKTVVVALLALMSVAVFLDVVHRLAATEGPLERLSKKLLPDSVAGIVSTALAFVIGLVLVYGALRTAKVAKNPAPAKAAGIAVGVVIACWATVKLLLWAAPNGLVWSQVFGLCGMLWVGFLGASIATKEKAHLTLEIVEFLWKGKAKAHVVRVGSFFAAIFCALLSWLCFLNVRFHYEAWAESEGAAGVFDAFPVPKFIVFSILPFTFAVMSLRMLGRTLGPTEIEKPPDLKPVLPPPPDAEVPATGGAQ